ncbi:MAG: hypothetical protein ACE5JO_04220 [Candidatus Binatia bacterium]
MSLSQHGVDKKQQILAEIDGLRSDVGRNPKIRLRAQTEIFEVLDKTVEDLDKDGSDVSQHLAASIVNMARKRASQAESQGRWLLLLAFGIFFFLVGVLVLAAWAMINYKLVLFSANPGWSQILCGVVLWGVVGSATDGLRELHTRVARQELDLNRLLWYLAHPVIGAALGGILFLVVSAGLLALRQDADSYSPTLVYALAALAGFGQRQVIQYLRETLADMLRIKREAPDEAG